MRKFTEADIERIRQLSPTHTIREIVRITGISKQMVGRIQRDPNNVIEEPKRKIVRGENKVRKMDEQYFDINAWGRQFEFAS